MRLKGEKYSIDPKQPATRQYAKILIKGKEVVAINASDEENCVSKQDHIILNETISDLAKRIKINIDNDSLEDILNALDALKKEGIINEILGDAEIIEFPSSNGTFVCKFVDIEKNPTEKIFLD